MKKTEYLTLRKKMEVAGYGKEITWSETLKPCDCADAFFCEFSWVVCNSGMKEQIARKIWTRIVDAIKCNVPVSKVFGHKGKSAAIQYVYENRERLFSEYLVAQDKLNYLLSMPWIGEITKFHLAKNLGFDCCKPDRHLVRISEVHRTTPDQLCKRLAKATGDRIATVDLVLWRCANLGWI